MSMTISPAQVLFIVGLILSYVFEEMNETWHFPFVEETDR